MSQNNITIMLDTTSERKMFADILAGIVEKGLTFNCIITGTKAVITMTGGF